MCSKCRGKKKVRYQTSGNKSQVTVIGCVSAAAHAIPPFVIFDSKTLNHEWTEGEVSATTYSLSDKGWVDSELFHGWLIDQFAKYTVCYVLLLLYGHSSHYKPDMIRYAKVHGIIFCLPPHTTREYQPLDVGGAIDVNTCYICFGMYEDVRKGTGREWWECAWVHED